MAGQDKRLWDEYEKSKWQAKSLWTDYDKLEKQRVSSPTPFVIGFLAIVASALILFWLFSNKLKPTKSGHVNNSIASAKQQNQVKANTVQKPTTQHADSRSTNDSSTRSVAANPNKDVRKDTEPKTIIIVKETIREQPTKIVVPSPPIQSPNINDNAAEVALERERLLIQDLEDRKRKAKEAMDQELKRQEESIARQQEAKAKKDLEDKVFLERKQLLEVENARRYKKSDKFESPYKVSPKRYLGSTRENSINGSR